MKTNVTTVPVLSNLDPILIQIVSIYMYTGKGQGQKPQSKLVAFSTIAVILTHAYTSK